jgi:hypothetical protein
MNASGRFASQNRRPAKANSTLTSADDLDHSGLTWDAALLAVAGDAMAESQGALFDERFLERHAGEIIRDPEIAIVELVANAWDAWATRVDIRWAERGNEQVFSITDNGKGMSKARFERRWRTLDYNKLTEEGATAAPPEELKEFGPRRSYGRNGKGRHAAFRFGDPYVVRTWCDGHEVTYEVQRGVNVPFDLKLVGEHDEVLGHGTEISAPGGTGVNMTAQQVREVIGTRFLADPNFQVIVDGTKVTFEDVPAGKLRELEVEVTSFGVAQLIVIDTQKADRTTRQHGIAWWVDNRLVGRPGWTDFDLDGRTNEAKRFQFIVRADFLAEAAATLPDWSGFDPRNPAWLATREAVFAKIREFLAGFTAERRGETKSAVRDSLSGAVARLAPASRDRWNDFVDAVVDTCPSISADEVEQVAGILAKLELAESKYGLIQQLHVMKPGDIDELHGLLTNWTVRTAKIALDEVQSRLKLIEELDQKLRDETLAEVGDLQPLFERSLWVFGPEFESLEFTSNRGMSEVIRTIFGKDVPGTKQRPDFVMLPDGSAGFYSRDSHDLGHEVAGVSRLVIAEIKKVDVIIGSKEKEQPWRYVKELIKKGLVTEASTVTCYVLGSRVDPTETGDRTEWSERVRIIPMPYNIFIRRAEKRMLGLRDKLRDAPFLKDLGLDAEAYLEPPKGTQTTLDLLPTPAEPSRVP